MGGGLFSSLIFDSDGSLYGTQGGNVYKLTPPASGQTQWTLTTLYSFPVGAGAYASLIFDPHGALYGTTRLAGTGYGMVYKLTPPTGHRTQWTETVVHSFTFSDGANPYAGVIFDRQGALYGTTYGGGSYANGTVFKID